MMNNIENDIQKDRTLGVVSKVLEQNRIDKMILYFLFLIKQLDNSLVLKLDLNKKANFYKDKILKNLEFRHKINLYYQIISSPDEARILFDSLNREEQEAIYNLDFYDDEFNLIVNTEIEIYEVCGDILKEVGLTNESTIGAKIRQL